MVQDVEFDEQIVKIGLAFKAFSEENQSFGRIVVRDIVDHRDPVPQLLANGVVPVLDTVCAYIDSQTTERGLVRTIGTRAAVLQFCANTLLRTSAGPCVHRFGVKKTIQSRSRSGCFSKPGALLSQL